MKQQTPMADPAPAAPEPTPDARAQSAPRPVPTSLTTGNIRRTVFLLALPVLGEQLLTAAVGIFDTFLAGRISANATSAVGVAAYVGWLASLCFMFVSTGTTALVSRFAGAGEHDDADHIANQSLGLGLILGVVVASTLFALANSFAVILNMTENAELYGITMHYLRVDAASHIFTSVTLIGAASLRGMGDTRTPMNILAVVSVLNVLVSAGLVYGLADGDQLYVQGIVYGTLVARALGASLMWWTLFRGSTLLTFHLRWLRPAWASCARIMKIGLPAVMDGLVLWVGQFVFLKIVRLLGSDPELNTAYFAAHIIGVRVEAFTYLPAVAWGYATATLVGQALGAKNEDRARRVAHESVLQCGLISVAVALFLFFGAGLVFRVMHSDPLVNEVGINPMKLVAFFQPCLVVSIVYIWALRGAGDTRYPMYITLISGFLFRIPIGYYFGVTLGMGLMGAWFGMCTDMLLRAILAAVRYARGKWVGIKV